MRVRSGVDGFDPLVGGGFPSGTCSILQGPPGNEKDEFALRFIAEGLRAKEAAIVLVSSTSPDQFLDSLAKSGVDVDTAVAENRLRIVDWYSRQRENVSGVDERGPILRCSIDLTDVSIAVTRAIAALNPRVARRGLFEILSPSLRIHDPSQVYELAQNIKAKLSHHKVTALFLLERDMHEPEVVSTVCQPFDGVVDIIREQDADVVRRKIVVLWLKDTVPDPRIHALEMVPGKGPSVSPQTPPEAAQSDAPPPPPPRERTAEPSKSARSTGGPPERPTPSKSAAKAASGKDAELDSNQCPNCGRLLTFEERETEGFCASCAIYVEIVKEPPEPPAQELRKLVRAEIQIAKRHELEVLCRESGLKLSGSRTDLVERLLHYLDRTGPSEGPGDTGRRPVPDPTGSAPTPESVIGKRELVLFLLSLGVSRKAARGMAKFFGTYDRFLEGDPNDVELFSGLRKENADRVRAMMKPRPTRPHRARPPPPDVKMDLPPPPPEEPFVATKIERASKPIAPAEAPAAATPRVPPALQAGSTEMQVPEEPEEEEAPRTQRRRWSKRGIFYAGVLLVAAGGSGLLLGSFFHDILRVPVVGERYEAFGGLNAAAALLGSILLAFGLGSIRLALRRPFARAKPARGG